MVMMNDTMDKCPNFYGFRGELQHWNHGGSFLILEVPQFEMRLSQ